MMSADTPVAKKRVDMFWVVFWLAVIGCAFVIGYSGGRFAGWMHR